MNAEGYLFMLRRMFGHGNEGYAVYDYMSQLPYYSFLCEVEEAMASDPSVVVAKLNETCDALMALGNGVVYGYVGSEEGRTANTAAVEAFLSGMTAEPKERVNDHHIHRMFSHIIKGLVGIFCSCDHFHIPVVKGD